MPFNRLLTFVINHRMRRFVRKLGRADHESVMRRIRKLNPMVLSLLEKYYLVTSLKHAAKNSHYYQRKLPELIRGLTLNSAQAVIKTLLFTTPLELSESPKPFLAIPEEDIANIHFTYGSMGKKKVIYNSKRDMTYIDYSYMMGFIHCGIDHRDIAQIVYSFGIWGLAENILRALQNLSIVTLSTGNYLNFQEQRQYLENFKVTCLFGTPSYVYNLAKEIELSEESKKRMKAILVGGECLPEHRRKFIEERLGGEVFINYGMNEAGGGIGSECSEHNGYHIMSTCFCEIIDPETGEEVEDGEFGELVLTTTRREAMPLIRYRTGDITRKLTDKCPCGLILPRLDYLKGRVDDRLVIGAAEKYYPIDFDLFLDPFDEIKDYWIEVVTENDRDTIVSYIYTDSPTEKLRQSIIEKFYSLDSIKIDIETTKTVNVPKVVFVKELSVNNKRRRLIDKRTLVKK